jgi:P-type Ca2+ transporter type 2C
VGLAFALLLSALYIPWAVSVLRFAPLPAHELAAACGLGLVSVLWFEGIKWARRSGRKLDATGSAAIDPSSERPAQGDARSS